MLVTKVRFRISTNCLASKGKEAIEKRVEYFDKMVKRIADWMLERDKKLSVLCSKPTYKEYTTNVGEAVVEVNHIEWECFGQKEAVDTFIQAWNELDDNKMKIYYLWMN